MPLQILYFVLYFILYKLADQIDHIMRAEGHSLSKETPQDFQDLREVVENYFHNVVRFVIFQLDPSNYQTAFRESPKTDYQQPRSSEKIDPVQF